MAIYDSKSSVSKERVNRIYSDLDLDFTRNPVTSDIVKLNDVDSVKRSVKNLIQTNHYERPFHPEIGSDIRGLLFENMTPLTALNLERKVIEVLTNFEPRAKIVNVIAQPQEDANRYHIQISFYVVGISTPVVVETYLTRLR
jgi:phage baseplate assembly protein W|tara:strand:+ start:169 stop:594 length:426 start_codon:yes stop_codon:yes gene_type:complete